MKQGYSSYYIVVVVVQRDVLVCLLFSLPEPISLYRDRSLLPSTERRTNTEPNEKSSWLRLITADGFYGPPVFCILTQAVLVVTAASFAVFAAFRPNVGCVCVVHDRTRT